MKISDTLPRALLATAGLCIWLHSSFAAIPLLVNHQGVLEVNDAPFDNHATFRFAFVSGEDGTYLWTNDGSKLGQTSAEPNAGVQIEVVGGLYEIVLGDDTEANMVPLPSNVFDSDDVLLRVWVDDGTNGIQLLTPDHPFTSAPYAFHSLVADSAGNADTVDGEHAEAFADAMHTHVGSDITSGKVPDADNLDGNSSSFFRNASNLNGGTVNDTLLSSNVTKLGSKIDLDLDAEVNGILGDARLSSNVTKLGVKIDLDQDSEVNGTLPAAKVSGKVSDADNLDGHDSAYFAKMSGDNELAFHASEYRGAETESGVKLVINSGNRLRFTWNGVDLSYIVDVEPPKTIKTFVIDHPSDPTRKLVHGTLEGPEGGVYYRGSAQLENGRAEIELPHYFEALTREEDRTIQLTNVDGFDRLAVQRVEGHKVVDGKFVVISENPDSVQAFDWEVKAVRADVEPLRVEIPKEEANVVGFGPYTFLTQ